ncbi:phosphatidate cytidylyltransferase [Tupanvirus deep ocean]|uniref:Phosphatidate cytidylyltransferase n=1 Tax=Tupanvirus soda lake TaxID=2126985 RepID=A0AC59HC68_9VIRU|nr:phosphatidate cytidylyltransferase [Tupanvirus deep ocean]AUL79841.2 phosphatidate cytidylyltransferase [Tupanvirus deep ocean]
MVNSRTLIGISLALVVILCLYFEYVYILYVGVNIATLYDAVYMLFKQRIRIPLVCIFISLMALINYYILNFYYANPLMVVKIITLTQISDVYQYIAGTRFGKCKIGWISKNKTYEGYVVGWLMTVVTFIPFLSFNNITLVYMLGVLGGLLSSLFKRIIGIKDYSDLLGPHGGWVDRIDSIILPCVIYYFII